MLRRWRTRPFRTLVGASAGGLEQLTYIATLGGAAFRYVVLVKVAVRTTRVWFGRADQPGETAAHRSFCVRSLTWIAAVRWRATRPLRLPLISRCISAILEALGREGGNENTNGLLLQYFPQGFTHDG